ncbi:MAG: tetratricopeptide repeat protein [Saprospiraceae bacterium]|nr:tetratricopeptide repeat protein [Saprospiraceae bacterium]
MTVSLKQSHFVFKTIFVWSLICVIVLVPLTSESQLPEKWEALKSALGEAKSDSVRIDRFLAIADYAIDHFPDSVNRYADEAITLGTSTESWLPVVSALNLKGINERYQGNYPEAKLYQKQGANIAFTRLEDSIRGYQLIDNMANVYIVEGKLDSALAIKLMALHKFKDFEAEKSIQFATSSIASIYIEQKNYDQGKAYCLEALNLAGSSQDSAFSLGNLGICYKYLGQPDSAIYCYLQAAEMLPENPFFQARNYSNIGLLYESKEEWDRAFYYLGRARDIYTDANSDHNAASTDVRIGKVLIEQGNYAEAKLRLESAAPLVKKRGQITGKKLLAQGLYRVYKREGDFKKALDAYETYFIINDSLNNADVDAKLADLELKYETAEKEKTISKQSLILEKQKNLRNILLLGLAFVLWLGTFLFFYLRRQSQLKTQLADQEIELRNQQIIQLENDKKVLAMSSMIEGQESERIRIARDLHDGLGAMLSSVKARISTIEEQVSHLENLNLGQSIGDMIDKASKEVRRISQNMAPQALRLGGIKDAVEDLANDLSLNSNLKINTEFINWKGLEDETKELMLYRIIQEIIQNTIKHSDAKGLLIQLIQNGNSLSLITEDDGKGFDVKAAKEKKGLGLTSIESRVSFLEGEMDIDSEKEKGTSYTITVPI